MNIHSALLRLAVEIDKVSSEWDSAAVLIVNDKGEGLILKRGPTAPWQPNVWNLPGGSRDPGEISSKAVAIREAQEEVGLTPKSPQLFEAIHHSEYLCHLYVSWGYSGTPTLDRAENTHMAWVGLDTLDDYKFIPGLKEPIRKALESFRT